MNSDFYKLMLVTHRQATPLPEYLSFIKQCVSSGVSSVQLREKNADPAFKLSFAKELKNILAPLDIPLIINDDVDLAIAVNADGVHLGQTDSSPQKARERLGARKFIGLSIESEEELIQANSYDLNYVAASAVFPSEHKHNLKTIWGIDGVQRLCSLTAHPIIGIGGINANNLPQLMQSGAHGAAIIGALHQANDPEQMAFTLRQIIDNRST